MKSVLLRKAIICLSAGTMIATALPADDGVSPKSTSDKRPLAVSEKDGTIDPRKDADNTDRNKSDRNDQTLTPGDQGNSKEDIEVTSQIRRALVKDKELSTTAKNVKIITKNRKVTLRGPVKTSGEKQAIVAKAKTLAAPVYSVIDQLEVKAHTEEQSRAKSVETEVNNKP